MSGEEFWQCFYFVAGMSDDKLRILSSSAMAEIFAMSVPKKMKLVDLLTILGGLSSTKAEVILKSPIGKRMQMAT